MNPAPAHTPRTGLYKGRWATTDVNGVTIYDHACTLEGEVAALLSALEPLAAIARIYDAKVYPPDSDSQLVSVCLGDLRKALAALTTSKP